MAPGLQLLVPPSTRRRDEDEGDHELISGHGSCIHFQVEMCMPNYVHTLRQVNNSTVA